MKIIYFFLLSFLTFQYANGWETNITLKCINDRLEKCSYSDTILNENKTNPDKVLIKPLENKKIDNNKEIKQKKKSKLAKKKFLKNNNKPVTSKIIGGDKKNKLINKKRPKNIKKNILKKQTLVKVNEIFDFDKKISFDEFKVLLINYTNNSDFPDIDK